MSFFSEIPTILRHRFFGHEGDGPVSSTLDRETEASGDTRANVEQRVIFINRAQPPVPKFVHNRISTAKYSIIRFIPLFLYEQFRRWANVFFLMIALLQQIPDVSPTGRYTTLVPLIFILSVSAVKEIIEDTKRHRADDETNHRKINVLRGDNWISIRWMDVIVGDIVKVWNNSFFPADLVLLSSSEPQGISFIETANLDGETNLKIRQAIPSTAVITNTQDLIQLSGTIECETPNKHLYEFNGVIKLNNKSPESLGPDQLLLRGAILRNTSWIFGIVIYTGHETKLMRNSTLAPLKRSTVDKLTNVQILLLFGVLFAMCLVCSIFNVLWINKHAMTDWYIGLEDASHNFVFNLLTFVILFNNLIPISLQVTLEVVRFVQAIFINMDSEMYHDETNTPAMARTSNLNEELGQVKYIFSDKTGTLTRNVMEFKKCAVGQNIYTITEKVEDSSLVQNLQGGHKDAEQLKDLLVLLSVCHTVIPEIMPNGTIVYHAASPDERALVYGASKYGYIFESRTPDSVEISALGVKERYEILTVLEFTSARKRMSVIVRDPKAKGLRTLCCAVADLKENDFNDWKQLYHKASISLQYREEKIEEAANMIERKLKLIGATAIEDKLQEGVPDTIAALLQADINLWVLTGDKQETAINIGYSCKLLTNGIQLLILNEDGLDPAREVILRHCEELGENLEKQNEIALIIDGNTLKYALSCELRNDFLRLCISCKVVICCRVSPLQKLKSEYVTDYKKRTLAIERGPKMSLKALHQTTALHILGYQDVCILNELEQYGVKGKILTPPSSYYPTECSVLSTITVSAIHLQLIIWCTIRFRFLQRLLFVHGAWNYSRMCKLILYSFYKNICLYQLWFQSTLPGLGRFFQRWSIGFYNVLFTALPPLAGSLR
ncbi:hypothetical protein JTB14_001064 [Gonioctena quinquepunctata]|nr:hypothetical protein JTB14_001064 [Gonioctena quinquepunctata]